MNKFFKNILWKLKKPFFIWKTKIIEHKYPYEPTILPKRFCPDCGCTECYSSGNLASYPERYEKIICAECKRVVGESDNSPYWHILEEMIDKRTVCTDPKCPMCNEKNEKPFYLID